MVKHRIIADNDHAIRARSGIAGRICGCINSVHIDIKATFTPKRETTCTT